MKKLLSILFLSLAFVVSSQNIINVTATKAYDANGDVLSTVTTTVYMSTGNITNVNNSGSGSIIYLRLPAKTNDGSVYAYSVSSTPAQVSALVSSTAINIPVSTTFTADATVTASQLNGGLLTVSSGTVTLTLPTAALLATQLGASAGSIWEFSVLNVGSGGTATIAVGSGITASGFPGSNTLTLANSATVGIARFRIHFISTTVATLTRIN